MQRRRGEIFAKLNYQQILTVILTLLLYSSARTQVYYSVNPNYLKAKNEGNNILRSYRNAYPDTAITEFQNYFPRNFLGNLGLPSPDYVLKYGTADLGFRV